MSETIRCPNCGHENDPGDVVCMGCGWPIGDDPGDGAAAPRSRR